VESGIFKVFAKKENEGVISDQYLDAPPSFHAFWEGFLFALSIIFHLPSPPFFPLSLRWANEDWQIILGCSQSPMKGQ
jgi:hypothetical protein